MVCQVRSRARMEKWWRSNRAAEARAALASSSALITRAGNKAVQSHQQHAKEFAKRRPLVAGSRRRAPPQELHAPPPVTPQRGGRVPRSLAGLSDYNSPGLQEPEVNLLPLPPLRESPPPTRLGPDMVTDDDDLRRLTAEAALASRDRVIPTAAARRSLHLSWY